MFIFDKNLKMKVLIHEQNSTDAQRIQELCLVAYDVGNYFDLVDSFADMTSLYSTENYDVLFINIDKDPKKTLRFLTESQKDSTAIIITSSENDMMIEAYNHHIAGYLSKPFSEEKFIQIVQRAIKKRTPSYLKGEEYAHFKNLIGNGEINRIALTTLDGYVIVHYDDIIRCEANGNYTSIYFHDGSFLMLTKTLKHYASRLEKHGFFRVHKTHLVNLNYIRTYVKGKSSYVELKDGSNIEVSSRKKQTLVEVLNK